MKVDCLRPHLKPVNIDAGFISDRKLALQHCGDFSMAWDVNELADSVPIGLLSNIARNASRRKNISCRIPGRQTSLSLRAPRPY